MMSLKRAQGRVVQYCPQFGHSRLFVPLPKNGIRPRLNVSYISPGDGTEFRFSAANALGVPEQTLLLALLELAKEQYAADADAMVIGRSSIAEPDQKLWGKLTMGTGRITSDTLRFTTTWYELNRRCGAQPGGEARKMRERQLERLCEVVVWETAGDIARTKRQSYLVAWLIGDDNRMRLALNARLASALMGGSYAQVSLAERLALDKDIPMAVHAFLSTAIAPGKNLKIGVETLAARFWVEGSTPMPAGTHRRHKLEIRGALEAIGKLVDWTVEWERNDLVRVIRRSKSVRDTTMLKANKTMSYRERAFSKIPCNINDLDMVDVSGLFFNTENAPM